MLLQTLEISDLVFYAFAILTVLGAVGAALSQNLVYSAFSLLGALFGLAALFARLSADYVAITQLIVYVGGILVLFLFAVMLTHKITAVKGSNPAVGRIPAAMISIAIFAILTVVALRTPWAVLQEPVFGETTHVLGRALLSTYLLPFEVLSVVLLAAMIGAVVMARKEIRD